MSLYDLKLTSRIPRANASDAIDETENKDKSVVTDSCEGDLNIRHDTDNTGVCGVFNFGFIFSAVILSDSKDMVCCLNMR